jgi:hypothetical protein
MAIISVPPYDPWVLAGWAHRLVLDRLLTKVDAHGGVTAAQDHYTVEQARALKGLNLELLLEDNRDQALRLAAYLHEVAGELQPGLRGQPEPRDGELAEVLAQLEWQLLEFGELGYVHIMRMQWGTAGQVPRFKIDGRDYPPGAAVRAVIQEAVAELSARHIPAELEAQPITRDQHGPRLPNWQDFRQRRAWQQHQPPPW